MLRLASLLTILAGVASAQNPIASDSPFQVRYATNLAIGDSVINMTNTGASAGGGGGSLTISGGSTTPPSTWETETGQSIPTGTAGFVSGVLVAAVPGTYTFTYGGGLAPHSARKTGGEQERNCCSRKTYGQLASE